MVPLCFLYAGSKQPPRTQTPRVNQPALQLQSLRSGNRVVRQSLECGRWSRRNRRFHAPESEKEPFGKETGPSIPVRPGCGWVRTVTFAFGYGNR